MKQLIVLAVGIFLSASLSAAANTVPAANADKPHQQGIKNARKVMQSKLERDKKMSEVRKNAQAMRRQAQSGK